MVARAYPFFSIAREFQMLDASQLLYTQIAAVVCLLIFAGFVFDVLRLRRRMEASKAWVKVDGAIISSETKIPPSHVFDDQDDIDPIIRYRYQVGGQTHESDCVKFGGQPSVSRALAETLVARYPPGARVDIYYNPLDPTNAVLEPGKQDSLVAKLVFALVFGSIAGILIAHAVAGKVLYAGNGVPIFAFALPLVAFLGAGLCIVSFVKGRKQAKASAQWPTTLGHITTSTVVEEKIEDKRADDDSGGSKRHQLRYTLRYRVDLRFAYQVGSRDFVGTAWAWGWTPIYGLRELAEQVTDKYRRGQQVTVYYDPAQPDVAVLEPANRQGSLAPLVTGAIFAVGGAAILMFFILVGFGH
jgi:hypothetical protein